MRLVEVRGCEDSAHLVHAVALPQHCTVNSVLKDTNTNLLNIENQDKEQPV